MLSVAIPETIPKKGTTDVVISQRRGKSRSALGPTTTLDPSAFVLTVPSRQTTATASLRRSSAKRPFTVTVGSHQLSLTTLNFHKKWKPSFLIWIKNSSYEGPYNTLPSVGNFPSSPNFCHRSKRNSLRSSASEKDMATFPPTDFTAIRVKLNLATGALRMIGDELLTRTSMGSEFPRPSLRKCSRSVI